MKKKLLTAGIDIGGTNTVFGFIDEDENYYPGNSIPTGEEENASDFIARLVKYLNSSFDNYRNDFVLSGLGIAAPGANYFNGMIEEPSNLKWNKVNFVSIVKEYFNIPIAMINDANAAALGEYYFGHTQGLRNFIVITLGTGMGAGIFVDGKLLFGERGLAGELGHIIVEPNGRRCNCGRSGCLETYVSATGMKRTVYELLASSNKTSKLRGISFNELTGQMISELAFTGDLIALEAFEITGRILGSALSNLSALFSPQMIVLFGGLVNAGDLLLLPTRKYFEEKLLNVHKGMIQLVISKLNDANAGILGAGTLILKELQKESSESEGSADIFERRERNAQ